MDKRTRELHYRLASETFEEVHQFLILPKRDDTASSQSSLDASDKSAPSSELAPPQLRARTGSTASVNQFKKSNDVYKSKSRTSTLSSIGESDLSLIKNYNKLIANELVHGKFHTNTGGMFAFVFDNSFSKTIAKSVQFSANVIATDVSQEEKIEHNDQQVFDNNADNSLAGEVLQSVMLKKRRKKLQGFVKRYFVLNLKRGSLSYFKVDDNKLRGQMPVKEAIISANPSNRQFIIDSGMEVWHLKAINQADFNAWVNAFNAIKRQDSPNTVVSKPSTPFKSSTELNIILQKLDKLRLENPSPLVGEIHQDILNLINRKSGESPDGQGSYGDLQSVYTSEYHDAEEEFDNDGVNFLDNEGYTQQPEDEDMEVEESSSDEEEDDDEYLDKKQPQHPAAGVALLTKRKVVQKISKNCHNQQLPMMKACTHYLMIQFPETQIYQFVSIHHHHCSVLSERMLEKIYQRLLCRLPTMNPLQCFKSLQRCLNILKLLPMQ